MHGQSPPNSDAFSVDMKVLKFSINGTLQQECEYCVIEISHSNDTHFPSSAV